MMERGNKNIVVIGGGYGGITAILRLARLFRSSPGFQLHLVDKNPFHTLKTRLHEAAVHKREVTIDIGRIIGKHNITFHLGTISAIDPALRTLRIGDQLLPYEYLILALGSQANFYNIPGLQQFAFPLQTLDDAERIYKHISGLCARASSEKDESARRTMLRFVIGGGGLSGIEFAAELADRLRISARNYRLDRDEIEVHVVEAAAEILPTLNDVDRERLQRKLNEKGIVVHTNTRIMNASENSVSMSPGETLPTSTIVWTGGIRIANLIEKASLTKDSLGRIKVDEYLRSTDVPNLFAIGDNAFIINPRTGKPVPAAAQFALQQGRLVAGNVHALATNGVLRPYRPRVLGEVISLGRHLAVGWFALPLVKKVTFIGFLGRLLKTAIHEKHVILLTKASRNWTFY
ncbi:MAG TPA: NAD(P)/FAD-dependent oxidoreductase [Bacteroidota bacterium]|nr:NAD(P)/FAD-dependent oxidoreductase [Bacteroidota bacterium]